MKNKRCWLLGALLLSGCKANQESLSDYVKHVEQQAQREVATLAPVVQFDVFHYAQHHQREPFVLPQEALVQNQPRMKSDCWQPSPRAKSGSLERYPLSQLRLRGVMSSGGSVSALIQTPQGSVMKIKAGQYLGLNNGRVTRVADDYLLIKETLPDGLGCWNQRNVKLVLK
ncbi:pilus assembly protein PilP [Vibrio fluvialis]|uniref:pilus assembly protein PilP n=1 Tax=Vibrio fluvialis TaxID=676 RepID=UPI0013031E6B|nr:pilus assembly protein PilP [Vibrio fluvialis]EKO3509083.1 pilus assembly protein PilP [Vibrio fluvialis]EKO5124338.1 pilus assembly protein PilP [Vibrio fluvialis]MBY7875471.1 pilus assembly protein PilP [Vibrio fluvialis]MBY7879531.1 pilus assembly protein PilP [Vibrio fluvialis]